VYDPSLPLDGADGAAEGTAEEPVRGGEGKGKDGEEGKERMGEGRGVRE
jgi:hypothetical protein